MREGRLKIFLMLLTAAFLVAFTISPFGWMLIISFAKDLNFLAGQSYGFTFSNWFEILREADLHVLDYLKNSLVVSVVASLSNVLVAAFAAYAITRMRFPGKVLVPLSCLAISVFPQISIVGWLYRLMAGLRLINTYFALVFPYIAWTSPLALWICLSYFSQVPLELDRAALVDGARPLKVLFRVVLPISSPGLVAVFLLVFIACFNEFLFALMLTTDHHAQTVPVGIAFFQGLHGEIPWGELMATSAMVTLPLVVLTLVFQRFIVRGLTAGAIRG